MTKTQGSQPIVKILRCVSRELDDAATSVDDLHQLVSAAVAGGVSSSEPFMHWAQTVDILNQKLTALSHYVGELAELMPEHWVVENEAATKKVKLSRLAERLILLSEHHEIEADHASGELEIF